MFERYGEKKLYEGGLSVRTTLDTKLQKVVRKCPVRRPRQVRRKPGYRGAIQKIELTGDWGVKLADVKSLSDIGWKMAVVLEINDQSARIGFQPSRELGGAVSKERQTGIIALDGVRWAKAAAGPARGRAPAKVNQVLEPGDVIYVGAAEGQGRQARSTDSSACGRFRKYPAAWW